MFVRKILSAKLIIIIIIKKYLIYFRKDGLPKWLIEMINVAESLNNMATNRI